MSRPLCCAKLLIVLLLRVSSRALYVLYISFVVVSQYLGYFCGVYI